MNDFLRIFLICCCMVLSFKLGKEYAFRYGIRQMVDNAGKALKEFTDSLTSIAKSDQAPTPNETLGDDFWVTK